MTNGTEVGQVFVRVNASGDALIFLKQVKDKIAELTRMKGASGSFEQAVFDTKPAVIQNQQLAMSLEEVAEANQRAIVAQLQSVPIIQKVTQESAKQTAKTKKSNEELSNYALIAAQNAASAGDFDKALALARETVRQCHEESVEYQVALKTLIMIEQQAATQARTLAKANAEGGAAMIKTAQMAKSGAQGIKDAFEQVTFAKLNYDMTFQRDEFQQFNASQEQTIMMNNILGKSFEFATIKAINEVRAIEGVSAALEFGRAQHTQYKQELQKLGISTADLEGHLAKLQATLERQQAAAAKTLEGQRVQGARQAVEQSKITARFNGTENALNNLRAALNEYGQSSRAVAIINQQIIRLEGARADALTRTAIAEAKTAERVRNYADALRILRQRLNELQQGGPGARGSLSGTQEIQTMINRMQVQQENFGRDWWNGPIGQLRNFSGTILALTGGFYTLRDAAVSTFQVMQQSAQFSTTLNQLKLLADTTEQYNESLAVARNNVALFGGSLLEAMQDMNRTLILSNQTGVSVEALNEALVLLATKDPQQGTQGAMIALNEALAEGNITSLRRRFEMTSASLSMFTDATLTADEQIALFEKEIEKIGISMDMLEDSVSRGTKAVNTFGLTAEETMFNFGTFLNNVLGGQMERFTEHLAQMSEYLAYLNFHIERGQQMSARGGSVGENALSAVTSAASSAMPFGAGGLIESSAMTTYHFMLSRTRELLDLLNPAAKDAAQGIRELNDAQTAGQRVAQEHADAINEFIRNLILSTAEESRQSTARQELLDISYALAEGQITLAQATQMVAEQFNYTEVEGSNLPTVFAILGEEAKRLRDELLAQSDAAKASADSMQDYIRQVIQSTNEEVRQAEAREQLNAIALELHNGTINLNGATQRLIDSFGFSYDVARQLAGGLQALGAAAAQTQAQLAAAAATAEITFRQSIASLLEARQLIGQSGAEAARIELRQAQQAYDRLAAAPGFALTNDEKIQRQEAYNRLKEAEVRLQAESVALNDEWAIATQNVQRELDQLVPQYEKIVALGDSATASQRQQALALKARIDTLMRGLPKAERAAGGGGGSARLSDQDKLNNQLSLDQLKADQQAQDALIAHEERMLEIRKDYAERTLRAIEEFQEDQKSGRASFYDSLTGIEDHGLQRAMSAQFEAAALEAGKIAQTLGPDVAAQFLQQMQKNIIDQAKRQQEISKALDKGSDDFNPALAEYLQGVDQLFRVSEQGAINQILRARDSLAMSEQGAMQDAEQKYIDALAKISDTASESAERRIEAVRLAGKEIDMEIAKVQELGLMYEKVGFTPGSQRTVALQGNAPDPMAGVSESLTAIAADITSVLSAIRSNTGETVGAIRRLSPSVTQ